MTVRRCFVRQVLTGAVLLAAWQAHGHAQNVAPPQAGAPAPPAAPATGHPAVLLPSPTERLLRSISFSLQARDQADFLFFGVDSVLDGGDPVLRGRRNPDELLWKGTLTLKLADVFHSASERSGAYVALEKYLDAFGDSLDGTQDPLRGRNPLGYFRRTDGADWVGRLLSGITLSASLADRSANGFGPNVRRLPDTIGDGDDSQGTDTRISTYSVEFDPLVLFPSGAETKTAYAALTAYLKLYGRTRGVGGTPDYSLPGGATATSCPDEPRPRDCLDRLAGGRRRLEWLFPLIPKVRYETVDEFDHFVLGGVPVNLPSFAEGALGTLTVTWDLAKIVTSNQDRIDAVAAGETANKLHRLVTATAPVFGDLTPPPARVGEYFHWVVPVTPTTGLTWKLVTPAPPSGGSRPFALPGVLLSGDGVLHGVPSPDACSSNTCDFPIELVIRDELGRSFPSGRFTIRVTAATVR